MSPTDGAAPHVGRLHPRPLQSLSGTLQIWVRGRLWLQVLIGMFLGVAVGVLLGPTAGLVEPERATAIGDWLAIPGKLFLILIQMIVIPLVFASIIRGLASTESVDQLRQVGLRVFLFFVATTALATAIGISLAVLIQPGTFVAGEEVRATVGFVPAVDPGAAALPGLAEIPSRLLNLLPANPLSSMVESDMLRVVIFAIVVGVALVTMAPTQARPLLDLLGSLQAVCMAVVRWAMFLAPFAVFGLTAQLTTKIGLDALLGLGVYIGTVVVGLLIMFAVYVAIAATFGGASPLRFVRSIREVLLLAFSTSSSAAVMPLTIRTCEEKLGIRPSITQFVIPLGATINMAGTALYQGVAAIFLAQVFGIDIGVGGMLLIVVTAVGASIGTPATPGVGIVILSMVLTSVGVPPAGIALLMGVDRILDMCRTTINVTGDITASLVMDRWVGGTHPARLEQAAEAGRERHRMKTGEDTLVQ